MVVAALRLLARMPLAWFHAAGAILGRLVYWSSPVYAERFRSNLRSSGICPEQCDKLLDAAIAETGKGATELIAVWFGSDEKVARLVLDIEGWEAAEAARARGKGVIFLTPHLGCFEITSQYVAQRQPIVALYRPPKLRWLEPLMLKGR